MKILIAGLLLWSAVHLVPSLGQSLKQRWIGALGIGGYKGSFSVLLILALVMIIFGWRHSMPMFLYQLPVQLVPVAYMLICVAFYLIVVANRPTRIKQVIRHPQLIGVALWSAAHLMLNGDSRSLILFGGLGSWAFVEIIAINRREGVWIKPDAPAWQQEILSLAIALVVFAVALLAHRYLSGVALV